MRARRGRSSVSTTVLVTLALFGAGVSVLGAGPAHAARTVNVPADVPTIQGAIDAAAAGDTIVVAPGTYRERLDFKGKAIEVRSSAGPASTIVDGGGTGTTVVFKSGETRGSVLRGFTITGGYVPRTEGFWPLFGAGIAIDGASPVIVGNVVKGNRTEGFLGGGIGAMEGASPLIQDNHVLLNDAGPALGGGIAAGGGAEIVRNVIEKNTASAGGGLDLHWGTPVVRNNLIRENQATGEGGGLFLWDTERALVVNNLIVGNTAAQGGGGLSWVGRGGREIAHVLNNTIAGNEAPEGTAVADSTDWVTLTNNIMVGRAGASVVHCPWSENRMRLSHNDVYNGTASPYLGCGEVTGTNGNISADPLFVASTDFRLRHGSPAIDAGDSAAASLPTTDLDGSPRVRDGDGDGSARVDLGAYETAPPGWGRFHALAPARILDTRLGVGAPALKPGPGSTVELQVTGKGGVPVTGVSAVVLNVTAVDATAQSFLTAWPTGSTRPVASNLNYAAGQTVPNLVVVKLGPAGKVSLYNDAGSAHLLADVAGWYGPEGGFLYRAVTPARILDTRLGLGAPALKPGPGSTLELQVTGQGAVPVTGVSAVVLNLTAVDATAQSYLTAWPTGESRPVASNLNYGAGQTVPNLVVVKVGPSGKVSLYNDAGSAHLLADVAGWYGTDDEGFGSAYTSVVPARILDTRLGVGAPALKPGPGSTVELQVTGRAGVPASGASAVMLNVTAVDATAQSFLTAWPTGWARPVASNLNYGAGQTVPNLVVVALGEGGKVSLYNDLGSAHLVADVAGWYGWYGQYG